VGNCLETRGEEEFGNHLKNIPADNKAEIGSATARSFA
jgi:hypothetical protein